jgi:hypothetical protein
MFFESRKKNQHISLFLLGMLGGWAGNSTAALLSFTDQAAFVAAISGATGQTINFDSVTAGTVLNNTATFENVQFMFEDENGLAVDAAISDNFATTSGTNALGLSNTFSQAFISGSSIELLFSTTIHAIGLFIIASPGDMGFADDAMLSAGNAMISNAEIPMQTLEDGGDVFFLGLIDSAGFSSATIESVCCGFFEFTLDDIQYATFSGPNVAVPAPAALPLLFLALICSLTQRKKHVLLAFAVSSTHCGVPS